MRMAGQGTAHWLAENGLTRSWGNTIGRGLVAPIERRFGHEADGVRGALPDDVIREQLAMYLGRDVAEDGTLDTAMRVRLAQLGQLEGPDSVLGNQEYVDHMQGWAQSVAAEQGAKEMRQQLAGALLEGHMKGMDRATLIKAEPLANLDWREGYTGGGNLARNILAGPVPAYMAVGGGIGVGVIGLQEVVKKLQNGEALSDDEAAVAEEALKQEGAQG